MPDFVESPRFPVSISEGSSGGPGFKTLIFEGQSGLEQSVIVWSRARAKYDVALGIRDKADMQTVLAFFYNVYGKAIGFRYKDWGDFQLVNEQIGVGNGVQSVFKITKTYAGGNPYVRRIFKPVTGTVTVSVNGVIVPQGGGPTQCVVNYTLGTVTFGASVIPPNTHIVRVPTGEFDVPVRFDIDEMNASFEGYESQAWSSIPLIEKKIRDYDE